MKNRKVIYLISLVCTVLLLNGTGFAQEVEEEVIQQVVEDSRPLYEKFGMTSTQLFGVMCGFTLVLLFVLVGMAVSLRNIIALKLKDDLKKVTKAVALLIALGVGSNTYAADGETVQQAMHIPFPDIAFWLFLSTDIILILVIIFFSRLSKDLLVDYGPVKERRWLWKFQKNMTDAVPIENEASILLDHDYDGIKELDNNLPPWWKYGFYITVVWGVVYFAYYMVPGGGLSQEDEFTKEWEDGIAEVAEYKKNHPNLVTAETALFLDDDGTINQGYTIFTEKCATCHSEGATGAAGPNLTDDYWINGQPTMENIFNIISNGAANGMRAWKNDLNGVEIQAVASYVLNLDPVDPPEGQEPKGDYYSPDMKEKPSTGEENEEEGDETEE